jgi:hypothetical protein
VGRVEVSIPQEEGKLLARIEARAKILKRVYEGDRVHLIIEGPESLLRQLKRYHRNSGVTRTSSTKPSNPPKPGSATRSAGNQKQSGRLNRPAIKKR